MVFLGIIYAIVLIAFLSYSGLMIKHAAQFRYLGPRTIYLTIFYAGASAVLILLSAITFAWMFLN